MTTRDDIVDRLERIETQLERVPTVDDPKGFVTKVDIAGMPTVDDPKGFLTKADIAGMPTVDDPKGFITTADLEAFGEREGAAMRAFVVDAMAQLRMAINADTRVLLEAERDRWRVVADGLQAAIATITRVDDDARRRDADLDVRVTHLETQSGD
jgi:hypothetical protein